MLRQAISATSRRGDTLRIIDLGGSARYWEQFGLDYLEANKVHVTLLNIDSDQLFDAERPKELIDLLIGDACDMDLEDNCFDLCHSNSVIEHVGDWFRMCDFAREVKRIAPAHFIQTPNKAFPIDPHFPSVPFFHRLPSGMRAALLRSFPIGFGGRARDWDHARAMVASSQLLGIAEMTDLFPDSALQFEMVGPLAKSLIMTKIA